MPQGLTDPAAPSGRALRREADRFDFVLVGGGLANGLVALALRGRRPHARVALVESGDHLGGNHTWCCHASDLDEEGRRLLAPLVAHRWGSVEVRFPGWERTLPGEYLGLTSARFDPVVRAALDAPGSALLLGARAVRVGADEVQLADGRSLSGAVVLDARGPQEPVHFEATGFQKFIGWELDLGDGEAPPARPLLMDATVAQEDGYRFVYVLPLGGRRVLVEETYYSDGPALDEAAVEERLRAYLASRGWHRTRVLRRERGVLPIPWSQATPPPLASPLRLGYAGGWFHPTTGFSLPLAARVATAIAAGRPEETPAALLRVWQGLAAQRRFCETLNRLLFRAAAPDRRVGVFERFYRLPAPVIERFYGFATTPLDRARILCGRPPRGVSLRSALFPSEAL